VADYTFTIKTPAELSGVEAAIERFERLRGQAKANGKDFADLDQKIAAAKASIEAYNATLATTAAATAKVEDESARYAKALEEMDKAAQEAKASEAQRQIDLQNTTKHTKDAGAETDAAGKKLKLFAGSGENVKKVINQITAEVPLLGVALRGIISPVGAAITAAGLLFHAVKKDIAETNAKLDEMAALAAGPLDNFAAAFKRAQNEATAANAAFIEGIAALSTQAKTIGADANAAVAAIQRLTSAQLELNNSAQAKAIAEVNLAETQGKMSAPQAIGARQQINEFYAAEARKAKTTGENEAIRVKEEEIRRLQEQAARLQGLTGPGTTDVRRNTRINTLTEAGLAAETDAKQYRAKLPDAQAALEAAQAALDQHRRDVELRTGVPGGRGGTYEFKFIEEVDKAAAAVRELEMLVKLNTQLADRNPARASQLAGQARAEDVATAEYKSLRDQIAQKDRELQELRNATALGQSVREQTGAMDKDTAKINADIERERLRKQAEAEAAKQPGKASPSSAAVSPTLEKGFDSVENSVDQFTNTVAARLARIEKKLDDAKSQMDDTTNV
jgi:hypothetical protein